MTHLNNLSEKTFQWKAVSNAFRGNARVFKLLKADGYTHVEFVNESGAVLHKAAVPGAEATLGTYATRANNMLREGCTWEEAKAPRKAIGPQGAGIRKNASIRLSLANDKVCLSIGDASVSVDSELNVTAAAVRYNEASVMSQLYSKAEAFVRHCVIEQTPNWLSQNFEAETFAVAGKFRESVKAGATIEEAQHALMPAIIKSKQYSLLGEVRLEQTGLAEIGDWVANVIKKGEAHD